jgi:hypothetical protein
VKHTISLRRIGALVGFALVLSCDSFIDPEPTDVLTPENFFKTSADAVAGVSAVYESTKWSYWLGYWYMSDVATDDIIAAPNFGSDGHRMSNYIFDATEWPMGSIWGGSYSTINRANAVLDRVPGITMDQVLRARLIGEAHFLRALAYFQLVRFFGDVPLFQHEADALQVNVARAPAADVYALIVSDLEAAAAALPATYSGADVGRVTSGAAKALLAKVYLTRQDWANAAQTAGQIIASTQYTLLPNWRDNFKIATEITNSESIFEINFDATVNAGGGSVHTLFSLPGAYPGGDAYGLMYAPPSLVNLFASSDSRGNHGTFMISPYTDLMSRVDTFVPSPAFAKYLDETSAQNMTARGWLQQSNNWIILRYADVLLMYAEAVNEGGTPGSMTAEQALNAVRTRAGIGGVLGLSQAAFRDSVRVERRREFVFEGHRWFDLSRWGLLDAAIRAKTAELQVLQAPNPETDVHGVRSNLLPIPQSERDANHSLTQNPGW